MLDPDFLLSLTKKIGLDMKRFARDSESEELKDKIEADFDSGVRSGVNGTPTFYINGSKLLTYDETYKSLLDAILLEKEA
jgi:predicted DsbA family dithiol-disulfide isomerase